MRYPAKWKRVLSNIKKYMAFRVEQPETVSAGVCLTISNFNVYYIDEVVNFFEKQNIGVYLNLVHWPSYQNITNIPTEVIVSENILISEKQIDKSKLDELTNNSTKILKSISEKDTIQDSQFDSSFSLGIILGVLIGVAIGIISLYVIRQKSL